MKNYRVSGENEMILVFLRSELSSSRFSAKLTEHLCHIGLSNLSVIEKADLISETENTLRKKILGEYRGWNQNREMFEGFPVIDGWRKAVCQRGDLAKIKYINYSYWNELSGQTSSPGAAAEAMKNNGIVFDVPNDAFISGVEYLKRGGKFLPVILITNRDEERYIIIEGHSHISAYALEPECFDGTECIIGYCGRSALVEWNGRV
ncbi:MAG: hypothetical protein PHZ09_01190 [Eubacteriales bacterium]|nr:hypothetical protein [Eubacteriales bacterium]